MPSTRRPKRRALAIALAIMLVPVTAGAVTAANGKPTIAIYASVSRLDPRLREASADLGARPWATFRHVTLPLTMPGVAVGAVFVFVLSIGNFITPDLLGGGRLQMVGNLIYDQFLTARDWPFGATLAGILILVMLTLLVLQSRLVGRDRPA